MELTGALHHSWDAGPTELRCAPLGLTTASGTRPAPLPAAPCLGPGGTPSLAPPFLLAAADDVLDSATLAFHLEQAVLAWKEEDDDEEVVKSAKQWLEETKVDLKAAKQNRSVPSLVHTFDGC